MISLDRGSSDTWDAHRHNQQPHQPTAYFSPCSTNSFLSTSRTPASNAGQADANLVDARQFERLPEVLLFQIASIGVHFRALHMQVDGCGYRFRGGHGKLSIPLRARATWVKLPVQQHWTPCGIYTKRTLMLTTTDLQHHAKKSLARKSEGPAQV